jgi:hypothetical protein
MTLAIALASIGIALVSLGASVYSARLAREVFWHQRRLDTPTVALRCHFGYVERRKGDTEDKSPVKVITIEAQNAGPRPVEVRGAGFVRPDGDRVYRATYSVEPANPPHVLKDGESMRFNFRAEGDSPPGQTFEVTRMFVDTGHRVWEADIEGWPGPVRIAKQWMDL